MTGEYGAMRSDYAGLRGDEGMFQSAEGKGCRDEGTLGLSRRDGRPSEESIVHGHVWFGDASDEKTHPCTLLGTHAHSSTNIHTITSVKGNL